MRMLAPILTAFIAITTIPALAQTVVAVGDLQIQGAFSRATLPRAPTGGAYFTIVNNGQVDDRLLSGTTPAAGKVELHEMKFENDIARMRELTEGLPIPAGQSVMLEPSGTHIMLTRLNHPLMEGETLPLTLTFERAGQVTVDLPIGSIAARTAPGGGT